MSLSLRFQLRLWLVVLMSTMVMGRAVAAEPTISLTSDALAKIGIKCENFSLGGMSQDGSTVVCWEREANPRSIARGKVVRLVVFRIDWATTKFTTSSVWVPCTTLDQMSVSPDGRWALCVTETGMRIVAVDLQKGSAHIVAGFQKGKAGFRVHPYLAWPENGKFVAVGYFYDENSNVKTESLVSVDPAGTSLDAVQQVRDITELNKKTYGNKVGAWFSSTMAYFAGYTPDKALHLYAWMGGDLVDMDKASGYRLMPGKDRVLYVADRQGSPEIVVQEVPSMKKAVVAVPAGKQLSYPLMSTDGSTILLSYIDFQGRRISTYFGREKDRWRLNPVPALQSATPGTLRLSPNGDSVAHLSRKGLTFLRLPAPQ